MEHPTDGLLAPDRLLVAIENSPLAPAINMWAIERACRDLMVLRRSRPDLTVGVNLFGTQFYDGRIAAMSNES